MSFGVRKYSAYRQWREGLILRKVIGSSQGIIEGLRY